MRLRALDMGMDGGGLGMAAWRDRLLASPRFRRFAAAFPLTRPIARRRAKALFDICAGFVYSQILLACVQLKLFAVLAEGPQTAAALSIRFRMSAEAMQILLDAAAALDLVERRAHTTYGLGPLGAAMVGNPGIAAMVEHHPLLYADLADPLALLRGTHNETALKRYWAYSGADDPSALPDDKVAAYSALMSASQSLIAEEVLAAWPMKRHRCLLDIAGGDGTFLTAVAAQAPHLKLMLFDLPPVADIAERRFATAGLANRAQSFGGNVFTDPLPQGADVVSLVRVIHDHDDAAALAILRKARTALQPGGTLLLAEPMAGNAGTASVTDGYFAFYLLAMGRGRARSVETLTVLLQAAGFEAIKAVATHTPMLTGLLVAKASKQ